MESEISERLAGFAPLLYVTKVGPDDEMPMYATNNSCDVDGCDEVATRMIESDDRRAFSGWSFACPEHYGVLLIEFVHTLILRQYGRQEHL